MKAYRSFGATFLLLLLVACGEGETPSNDRLIEAFEEGRTGIWVSGHGQVTQTPSDELGSVPAQRIVVRLSPELTITLRHELDASLRVPAERGDTVAFQGYYEWDGRGGTVSRTYANEAQPGGGG